MEISFLQTKSGNQTFSVDNIFFHSKYSPVTEAERFISTNNFDYAPRVIILIEPGFSYLYSILKKKYSDAKIGIIRIINQIPDSATWDFCININDFSKQSLSSLFNESELLCTQFLCWPVSQKLFPEEIKKIYSVYKEAFEEAKSLIITRQYFEKKWFINAFQNIKYLNKYSSFNKKIDVPIVIAASGPSLEQALPAIKKNLANIFLICLSSAVSVLYKNQIIPDLILSSDGGFWAGQHLKKLSISQNIIALPLEAFCPKNITHNNIILPLYYTDGLTKDFFNLCNINALTAQRNGTVSGTALELAQFLTDKAIYFCGLDLSSSNGFQHTQPNEIELNNSIHDYKLSSQEERISKSQYNTYSLSIYRNWFCKQKNISNVFRIIKKDSQKSLGKIIDISVEDFENKLQNLPEKSNYFGEIKKIEPNEKKEMLNKLYRNAESILQKQEMQEQLFPLDFVSLRHCKNTEEKEEVLKRIKENNDNLIKKIQKICGIK